MTDKEAQRRLDLRLTAERAERKFLVDASETAGLRGLFDRHLTVHDYAGEGANRLPHGQHFTTTIYFDTPGGDLLRSARKSRVSEKLRAREYYDLHPDLTELATSPEELYRYSPTLWLELKSRDGSRSAKRRLGLPKEEVPEFLRTGEASARALELTARAHGGDAPVQKAQEIAAALRSFHQRLGGAFVASCLVNYRRLAWQEAGGALRVTFDREVTAFAPPDDLWSAGRVLCREAIGTPVKVLQGHVLEVKSHARLPAWLECALKGPGVVESDFSKFVAASEAL